MFIPRRRRNSPVTWGIHFFIALALVACGGGGDSETQSFDAAVAGVVMKGPVEGAAVRIYNIKNGARDALIAGPSSTERQQPGSFPGRWGSPAIDAFSPFIVVVSGGSYTDEATSNRVNLGFRELLGFKLPFEPSVTVTPISHALLLKAKALMNSGASPTEALSQVEQAARHSFGFNAVTTLPSDPLLPPANLSLAHQKYTALLGGISHLLDPVNNANLTAFSNADPFDLVLAFAKDLADGNLDGAGIDENGNIENPILVDDGSGATINFPALTTSANGIDVLFNAAIAFAASANNLDGVTTTSFPVTALRFDDAGNDFVPTVVANGDPLHPTISWTGQAQFIRVSRASNTNPLAKAAWVVGVNSGSFPAPVVYYNTPLGAFSRNFLMTNGGQGEPNLELGAAYNFTVTLDDNTSGTATYTPQ